MLNACRRGPASILRVTRTVSASSAPILRSSPFSLAARDAARAVSNSRSLHKSAGSKYNYGASAAQFRPEDDIEVSKHEGPVITEFEELADKGLVHRSIIRQIVETMGHKTMTPVQTLTINETLKGTDV
jgi:ATP-dependent RNA helicase MSS116